MMSVKASLIPSCQNSNAESVLIHHRDIALLREVRRTATVDVSYSTSHAARRQ